MNKLIPLVVFVTIVVSGSVVGQVRPVETKKSDSITVNEAERVVLDSIYGKYLGGLFGYSKKEHGTFKFDMINERLKFMGEDGKERFSIPFRAIVAVYPSQQKVQSGAGRAVGAIPLPGASIGGLFMKKSKNYLIIGYDDPDVDAQGSITFLVDTWDMLMNSVYTVGEKAELSPRGDAYIRRRDF